MPPIRRRAWLARACSLGGLAMASPAGAQTADTVLINGKVLTVDAQFSIREAVAIRDGKITAVGTTTDVRKLAGAQTRVIDLQGRTVIPGLIDSHLHAIRAALSFSTEVNWIGARSLVEGVARIRNASRTMKPGAWLIVAGGWNVQQFKENRRPTQAELVAAAPSNPVYIQLGYGWAMLTPSALKLLNISSDADVPAGGKLERDAAGQPTGAISGGQGAIIALFDKLPKPTFEQQVDGTRKFFRELNRLGITGVYDPGGNNLLPDDYQAIFNVWRQHEMTVRVAYTLCGNTPGGEFEDLCRVRLGHVELDGILVLGIFPVLGVARLLDADRKPRGYRSREGLSEHHLWCVGSRRTHGAHGQHQEGPHTFTILANVVA